jgi:hypothetical protein
MRHTSLSRRSGKAFAWLLVGLLIGGAAGAGTVYVLKRGKAGIPGGPRLGNAEELAMVPADSVGFIHIRARDLWKSEDLSDLRKVIDKAGPDALNILDESFVPKPSSLDRLTLVVMVDPNGVRRKAGTGPADQPKGKFPALPPERPAQPIQGPDDIVAVGVLAFSEAYDAQKVRSAYIPNAVSKKATNGKEYWIDEAKKIGMYFPNDRTMVIGMSEGVAEFVRKQTSDGKPSAGPLAKSLTLAAEGGRHLVGAVNMQSFQLNPTAMAGELRGAPVDVLQLAKEVRPILRAEAFAFALGVAGEDSRVELRGYYKDEKDAQEAEASVRGAAEEGRKLLAKLKTGFEKSLKGADGQKKPRPIEDLPQALLAYSGLGGVNSLDELLANPPLKRDGSEVVLSFDKPTLTNAILSTYATVLGALFESVGNIRTAAARMSSSNNLKQIGLAMHNYHDVNGFFPPQGGAASPKDKAGLSWRVHILPYIEQDALYKQFKLDEPWDSENNKKLIDKMPVTYVSPLATAPPGQTYYKVFSGKDAIFYPGAKTRMTEITDGTSNTILAVEGGQPVVWTKPDDIPFDGKIDPKSLALPDRTGINIGMADGSVRWIELSQLTPQKLAAAITRAGGEAIFLDEPDGPGAAFPGFPIPKGPGEGFPIPKPPVPKGGPPPFGNPKGGGAAKGDAVAPPPKEVPH